MDRGDEGRVLFYIFFVSFHRQKKKERETVSLRATARSINELTSQLSSLRRILTPKPQRQRLLFGCPFSFSLSKLVRFMLTNTLVTIQQHFGKLLELGTSAG